MKKTIIILSLTLSIIVYPMTMEAAEFPSCSMPVKKNSDVTALLKLANKMLAKGYYEKAKKVANDILALEPDNWDAQQIITQCDEEFARQAKAEREALDNAISSNSKYALQSFIKQYPKSSLVTEANNRISDYDLWAKAQKTNTKAAYQSYLNASSGKYYQKEANARISEFQAVEDWENCKSTATESAYENYVSKYPNSEHKAEAQWNLNVLKGQRLFDNGDRATAYNLLKEANATKTLTGTAAADLQDLEDEQTYYGYMNSNDSRSVINYLSTLTTNSKYYQSTSDHVAELLTNDLNVASSESDMTLARTYAISSTTKSVVESKIAEIKAKQAQIEHDRLVQARKEWWRDRFTAAWQILDINTSGTVFSLGTGLKFRFGRYNDFINLIFGANYEYMAYVDKDFWSDDDAQFSDYSETLGHMVEVPVGLRFNLFGNSSKFYLGCNVDFAFRLGGDYVKNTTYLEPQLGWAGRHWDFGLYYKLKLKKDTYTYYDYDSDGNYYEYTSSDDDMNKGRFGLFVSWYF